MSIANQQLRTNEQLLWNDNFDEMNISEDPNRSEGEQFYSLETNDFSSKIFLKNIFLGYFI